MEGISYKRKDFGGIYPKALMAVDESMRLQSRQQFFRGLAADHCFMELDHLCLVADLLQIQNFGDRYALSVAPLPDPDGRCLVKALFQGVDTFIQGRCQIFFYILFQDEPSVVGEIGFGSILRVGGEKNDLTVGTFGINGLCQVDAAGFAFAQVDV